MSEIKSFKELVLKNRSFRRFDESKELSESFLKDLVSLTSFCASAGNLQPLRYRLVHEKNEKEKLFESLFWAAYFKDWDGPKKGERPGGYIIIAKDKAYKTSHYMYDTGIAAQSVLLGAVSQGYGGCMIASFKSENIKNDFFGSCDLEPVLVIALGVPVEEVVIETIDEAGDKKYFRDEKNVHHVPKIKTDDILIK